MACGRYQYGENHCDRKYVSDRQVACTDSYPDLAEFDVSAQLADALVREPGLHRFVHLLCRCHSEDPPCGCGRCGDSRARTDLLRIRERLHHFEEYHHTRCRFPDSIGRDIRTAYRGDMDDGNGRGDAAYHLQHPVRYRRRHLRTRMRQQCGFQGIQLCRQQSLRILRAQR